MLAYSLGIFDPLRRDLLELVVRIVDGIFPRVEEFQGSFPPFPPRLLA